MRPAVLALLVLMVAPTTTFAQGSPQVETHLVSFHGTPPGDGQRLLSATVVESFPFARVALVEGPASAFDAIRGLPDVAGVYPEEPLSFSMERARGAVAAEPLPADDDAWPRGGNVTIAIVDSGLDTDHPAFEGRVAAAVRIPRHGAPTGGEGDDDGHGTHVAGIAAGDGAGSRDGRHHGIAPDARLVSVDISDSFTTTSAVRAFEWIHERRHELDIRVVSNSWGREKDDAHYDADDPVIRASDALVADGLVVVFSAGNRGRSGESSLTTEATNPNVITVGAASSQGRVESYSSRGPALDGDGNGVAWVKPDIVATGTGILSTRAEALAPANSRSDEERYYVAMNGTSMAAPQVAAAAALLLDAHPELSPSLVASILLGTARDVAAPGPDATTGYGMLDVRAALRAAADLEGGERLVEVERRIPLRREGTATAAEGLVVLAMGAAQLPPTQAVTLPLAFPAGTRAVDLWFNWSGPGAFDVVLVDPDGRAIPFEQDREGHLRLHHDAADGLHTLEARPTGAATSATFTLVGSLLVRETRMVHDDAVPFHLRADMRGNPGAFTISAGQAERLVGLFETAPLLVLALAGGIGTLAGLRGRATRKA